MNRKWTCLVTALMLAAACAPVTPPPAPAGINVADPHRYTELTPGVSTEADAVRVLGNPNSYSAMPGGQTLLQWTEFHGAHGIHLAILFGGDRRMIRVQHITVI